MGRDALFTRTASLATSMGNVAQLRYGSVPMSNAEAKPAHATRVVPGGNSGLSSSSVYWFSFGCNGKAGRPWCELLAAEPVAPDAVLTVLSASFLLRSVTSACISCHTSPSNSSSSSLA
eukprot:6481338-Amphidinium_carterae.3